MQSFGKFEKWGRYIISLIFALHKCKIWYFSFRLQLLNISYGHHYYFATSKRSEIYLAYICLDMYEIFRNYVFFTFNLIVPGQNKVMLYKIHVHSNFRDLILVIVCILVMKLENNYFCSSWILIFMNPSKFTR